MPANLVQHSETLPAAVDRLALENSIAQLLHHLSLESKDLSIVLMDDSDIAAFNQQYRNRKGPTNVLSFPALEEGGQLMPPFPVDDLGDILISVETAVREAEKESKSLNKRLLELVVHGLLHLLGYDHERSEAEALFMWDKEQSILSALQQPRRKTMVRLAVNVDHIATIRQARGTIEPDPVLAAGICELAGAAGIVIHLREDRRHIQDRDLALLRQTVKTRLNLEMAATAEMLAIAAKTKPDMITLVPEKRKELTTEGGLDVVRNRQKIAKAIEKMTRAGIPVSLFIDPVAKQIQTAAEIGATYVELHTGLYCDATTDEQREKEFGKIRESAGIASAAGLLVNAGHGLDYRNVQRIAALHDIDELSIGHAIISRAVLVGLDKAVREMLALIRPPFPGP